MSDRFTSEHIARWHRDGVVVIPQFFTPEEVSAVCTDFETVFGRVQGAEEAMYRKHGDRIGRFHDAQFKEFKSIPLDCSPALNLAGVHPALIAFAKAALASEQVHLYQSQAWAKFTGDADYDQPFHCDFNNHTLTVPSEDVTRNSVVIMCYFTDVSEAHGPMHYVPRTDSAAIGGPERSLDYRPERQVQLQEALAPFARSSASPAGSIVIYSIDVFHRGTNLTAPRGRRFALTTCFRRVDNDSISYHAWPFHHLAPWHRIFEHATPEQLSCFGVPMPGDPFWTPVTLSGAQIRYPRWDMTIYRNAMTARQTTAEGGVASTKGTLSDA
jgi:ectoine hydroxylase-related dioxygenase (phytanoyl-CoA dioxygenase family)